MAWTKIANDMILRKITDRTQPVARLTLPGRGAQSGLNDPITAIEMRALFAPDLVTANQQMSASYN